MDFLEVDTSELFELIDPVLLYQAKTNLSHYNYDYLHGALGILYYVLAKQDITPYQAFVSDCLNQLEKMGINSYGALAWHNYDIETKTFDKNSFNLGLSHGMPSIISVLCKVYKKMGDIDGKVYELISRSVDFLVSVYQDPDVFDGVSIFPYVVNLNEPVLRTSRLAWCYGDLGVAIALYSANQILKRADVDKIILKTVIKSASRLEIHDSQVSDAGLCHGSAGLGYIFDVFHRRLNEKPLKVAADYWYDYSLKQAYHRDGFAGFKSYHSNEFINSAGFLDGVAGIGLSYLSRLSGITDWDQALLISIE